MPHKSAASAAVPHLRYKVVWGGGGGVENGQKIAHVLYGCPITAGVVSRTINWEKYFQVKEGVCDCFFAKKFLMTALNFTSPVYAFVRIINIWNTTGTVLNTQKPYLMNIKYLTLKTFIFTTCSCRFLRFSNIAFHVL